MEMNQKPKTERIEAGEFYPRKIAKSGNDRYIAVTRILPKDWQMVKLSVVKLEENECILKLVRLM